MEQEKKLLQAVDRVISSLKTQEGGEIVDDHPDYILHAHETGVDELLTGAAVVIRDCQANSENLEKHGVYLRYPPESLSEQEKEEKALLIIERPSHTVSILGSLGQVHIYLRF